MGRLICQVDPEGGIETSYYDGNHNLIKSIDKKGNLFKYDYNYRNLLSLQKVYVGKDEIETKMNHLTKFEYANANRMTALALKLLKTHSYIQV